MKEIIDYMIAEKLNDIHTTLPGVVKEIDYARGICSVEIDSKRFIGKKEVKYPKLIEVKMDNLTFGSWKLQLPRKEGDKVWVSFSEVTEDKETSQERFSLNEPFISGSRDEVYESNGDDIILAGVGTKIAIKGDGTLEITTGANETVINSNLTIKGNIKQEGNFETTGTITANGIIKSLADLVAVSTKFLTHMHKYIPGAGIPTDTQKPS